MVVEINTDSGLATHLVPELVLAGVGAHDKLERPSQGVQHTVSLPGSYISESI